MQSNYHNLPSFLTIARVTGSALCISSMLCSSAIEASQAAALQQAPMHTADAGWGARSLKPRPEEEGRRRKKCGILHSVRGRLCGNYFMMGKITIYVYRIAPCNKTTRLTLMLANVTLLSFPGPVHCKLPRCIRPIWCSLLRSTGHKVTAL